MPAARRLRRRWFAYALVASGIAAVAAIAVGQTSTSTDQRRKSTDRRIRGGPLAQPGSAMSQSLTLDVGKRATYGTETVENHGKATAVLDRIVFRKLTPGLRILGPLVMRLGDNPLLPGQLATGIVRRFPPNGVASALHSLAGFAVHPYRTQNDAVELLIGIRPLRQGSLSYRALVIYYHVGRKRYVTTFPDPLRVCAPYGPISRCPPLETKPGDH